MKIRKFLTPALAPALITGLSLLAATSGFAQEEGGPEVHEAHSILDMVLGGGPLIIMIWIAILATSIIMVTFIIQNVLTLKKDRLAPPALFANLKTSIDAGNYQEAWEVCNANNNYLANVLKSALTRIGRGKDAVEDALAEQGLREATSLRTRNSYLSVIGVVSPMIGLLGTVIGMMGAFAVLGQSGIADPRALASSIGEVLLATASGLFIAIPAFVAYYVFRNMSQAVIVYADDRINNLVRDLPYEELRGIKVGDADEVGAGYTATNAGASQSRKVSVALTTNCPICNGEVTPGQNPCPHCSSTLEWAQ